MGRERLTTREANRRKKTLKRNNIVSKATQKSHNRPEDWPSPEELENLPSEEARPTADEDHHALAIDMSGKKAPSPEALETETPEDKAVAENQAQEQKETPSAEADEAVSSEEGGAEAEEKK